MSYYSVNQICPIALLGLDIALGKAAEARQEAYRLLFRHHLAESSVAAIRDAPNKAWVLGSDRFKQRVQRQLERRVEPSARAGDRKSEKFKIDSI